MFAILAEMKLNIAQDPYSHFYNFRAFRIFYFADGCDRKYCIFIKFFVVFLIAFVTKPLLNKCQTCLYS